MLLAPAALRAANAGDNDRLRQEAEALERRGDWDRAGELYLKMLAEDRQSVVLRKKLLLCSASISFHGIRSGF